MSKRKQKPRAVTLAPGRWHRVSVHFAGGRAVAVYVNGKKRKNANGTFRIDHAGYALARREVDPCA